MLIMERSGGEELEGKGEELFQSLRPHDFRTDGQADTEDLGPLGESEGLRSVGRKDSS